MPVTPEEWESGVAYTPLAKGLLSFLRENSPMGFSFAELFRIRSDIGSAHGFDAQGISPTAVTKALDGLLAKEHIESKELEDETSTSTYYRATN